MCVSWPFLIPLNLCIHVLCYFVRWSVLPEMCKRSNLQSALCIAQGDNDVVVLVVGGCGGKINEAELL